MPRFASKRYAMNEREARITNIEFRKVYLSDLNSIINIYRKTDHIAVTKPLTIHFGLPLSVAVQQDEIIGFAAAVLDEHGQTKLNSYGINVLGDQSIGSELEEQAANILQATFEHIREDHSPLEHAIYQLTGWLNKCF